MPNQDVQSAIGESLAKSIQKGVPAFAQIMNQWPNANEQLKYPSLSILTQEVKLQNLAPYEVRVSTPNTANKVKVLQVIGDYEIALQLDLWCGSKKQRGELYESLFLHFNSRSEVGGLDLSLDGYYNTIAHYIMTGFRFEDSDVSAQRREWRVIVDVTASCKALRELIGYSILTSQLQSEIGEEVNIL